MPDSNEVKLRAWWFARQGLDGSLAGSFTGQPAAGVLARSGWARSVGGSSPYLTLFARAGIGRAQADAALAKLAIQELPCARGCTYVVPEADYGLALAAGDAFAQDEMKVARKLGVNDAEIARLGKAVLEALAKEELDPEGLKARVAGAVRSLGPEGVKKGISTTLPVALGLLQAEGSVRRVPVGWTSSVIDMRGGRRTRARRGRSRRKTLTPNWRGVILPGLGQRNWRSFSGFPDWGRKQPLRR